MCNEVNVAKAEKEVVEELKTAMEKKLEESAIKTSALEAELKETKSKINTMETKLKKKNKKIRSMSLKLEGAEEKILTAEKKVVAAEEKVLTATKRIEQTIEEAVNGAVKAYVQSKAFDDKLHEAGVESYNLCLADCLNKIKKHYPDLDTLVIEEDSDDEDSDEENSDKEDQVGKQTTDQPEDTIGNQTKETAPNFQISEDVPTVLPVDQVEIGENIVEQNVNDQ